MDLASAAERLRSARAALAAAEAEASRAGVEPEGEHEVQLAERRAARAAKGWRRLVQMLFTIRAWQRIFSATGEALQALPRPLLDRCSTQLGGKPSRRR